MPSHVKTYQKKPRLQANGSSNSVAAVNALFAQNLTKRLKSKRKAKVKLKELPPRTGAYLTDDSLDVGVDTTFDRLRKGTVFNDVNVCSLLKIKCESSKSASFHSPIMTRSRQKSSTVGEGMNSAVTKSLSIEKETHKLNFSSLSYIKIPNNQDSVHSSAPLFIDTFRDRHPVHSSTPYVAAPGQKLIHETLSPITKSDSSNSSKLIEKSYNQIREWDERCSPFETYTPKKNVKGRRRKISETRPDWKLTSECYVKMAKNGGPCGGFPGFAAQEQKSSSLEAERLKADYSSFIDEVWTQKGANPVVLLTPRSPKKNKRVKLMGKVTRSINENSKGISADRRKSEKVTENNKRISANRRKSEKVTEDDKRISTNRRKSEKVTEDDKRVSANRRKSEKVTKKLLQVRKSRPSENVTPRRYTPVTVRLSEIKISGKVTRRRMRKTSVVSQSPGKETRETRNAKRVSRTSQRSGKVPTVAYKATGKATPKSIRRSSRVATKKVLKKPMERSPIAGEVTPTSPRRAARILKKSVNTSTVVKERARSSSGTTRKDKESRKKKTKAFITRRTYRGSDLVKKRISLVDLTDDILSEKEMSYSPSERNKANMTVDLTDFENFVLSYYGNAESESRPTNEVVAGPSNVIDLTESVPVPCPETKDSPVSPTRSDPIGDVRKISIRPNPKIVILSNIVVSPAVSPMIHSAVSGMIHDHSYSSPGPPPPPATPPFPLDRQDLHLSDIIESSLREEAASFVPPMGAPMRRKPKQKAINIRVGKSYRRSLSLLRRSSVVVDSKRDCPEDCVCLRCIFKEKSHRRRSSIIVPAETRASLDGSLLEQYARGSRYVQEEERNNSVEEHLDESLRSLSIINVRREESRVRDLQITAKDLVLRRCGQTDVIPFQECYPPSAYQNCHKIGEGVYGEVFLYKNQNGGTTVMKIIPIEGDLIVNGERQKKFDEILSEIVIAMELSNLRTNRKNATDGFAEVQKIRCVKGSYPDRLLDLWELYDETKGSENESPQMFGANQTYIVLELANAGKDLEGYVFDNAKQAFAMFKQTACALAVAETELKFEHRDLHWGNVLINTVDKNKTLYYRLEGQEVELKTWGVEATVIDFTLSRIEFDGVVIFNDLSLDNELFIAKGDYQFEIYRLMQKSNANDWKHFEPYTNILWLHYLLDKIIVLRYKNIRTKIHKEFLMKLKKIKEDVLAYNSVTDFVKKNFM